jgi:hypothetical protein
MEEEVPVSPFGLSIGVKAGTQGVGGEVVFQVNPGIHLRLGGSYFKYVQDLNQLEEQVQGEAFAKVGGVSLLANFHIGRPFFISVGAIYNFLEADAFGLLSEAQTINGVEYLPDEIGTLELNFKPGLVITPYAGVGFGRAIAANGKVSFAFELGVVYLDSPKVMLNTTGMIKPTSNEAQQKQLAENVAWMNMYPAINFQLSYRIF